MLKIRVHLVFQMKNNFTEALGIAGDLNITANIEEIKIFREENDSISS